MFKYQSVHLEAFGYALPKKVVTSSQLEQELGPVYKQLGLHEGRLELMTGIRERRFWENGTMPSDASTLAGKQALDHANLVSADIECLMHTAVSRDCLEPATASVVHHNLSLPRRSVMYDISNACLGFLNGMASLANMIELGQVKRGLIVAGESSRQLVQTTIRELLNTKTLHRQDLKAAFASLTIGSGAVGLVMTHESVSKTDHRLLGGVARTASEHNGLCRGSSDTGFTDDSAMTMKTDAEALLKGGCELAAETWVEFKKGLAWGQNDVDRTFSHQVGSAHREKMYESLGLSLDNDFSTFEFLGNVGSVSLPLTMAMGIEQDEPPPHTKIAMLGIGSGLCSAMLGIEW